MQTNQNWRLVLERQNIVNIMEFLDQQNCDVKVWQNLKDERETFECRVSEFDIDNDEFSIIPKSSVLDFDFSHPLFIYSEEHRVIIKVKSKKINGKEIRFSIPDKCLAHEKRKIPRKLFHDKDKLPQMKFTKPEFGKIPMIFSKEVFDFSSKGVSFRVTKNEEKYFFVGDSILVKSLIKSKNGGQVKGRIRYIKRQWDERQKMDYFRVGVIFDLDNQSQMGQVA